MAKKEFKKPRKTIINEYKRLFDEIKTDVPRICDLIRDKWGHFTNTEIIEFFALAFDEDGFLIRDITQKHPLSTNSLYRYWACKEFCQPQVFQETNWLYRLFFKQKILPNTNEFEIITAKLHIHDLVLSPLQNNLYPRALSNLKQREERNEDIESRTHNLKKIEEERNKLNRRAHFRKYIAHWGTKEIHARALIKNLKKAYFANQQVAYYSQPNLFEKLVNIKIKINNEPPFTFTEIADFVFNGFDTNGNLRKDWKSTNRLYGQAKAHQENPKSKYQHRHPFLVAIFGPVIVKELKKVCSKEEIKNILKNKNLFDPLLANSPYPTVKVYKEHNFFTFEFSKVPNRIQKFKDLNEYLKTKLKLCNVNDYKRYFWLKRIPENQIPASDASLLQDPNLIADLEYWESDPDFSITAPKNPLIDMDGQLNPQWKAHFEKYDLDPDYLLNFFKEELQYGFDLLFDRKGQLKLEFQHLLLPDKTELDLLDSCLSRLFQLQTKQIESDLNKINKNDPEYFLKKVQSLCVVEFQKIFQTHLNHIFTHAAPLEYIKNIIDSTENPYFDINILLNSKTKIQKPTLMNRFTPQLTSKVSAVAFFLASIIFSTAAGLAIGTAIPGLGHVVGGSIGAAVGASMAIQSVASREFWKTSFLPSRLASASLLALTIFGFAGLGAAIGSAVPGVGTLVGALGGAALGAGFATTKLITSGLLKSFWKFVKSFNKEEPLIPPQRERSLSPQNIFASTESRTRIGHLKPKAEKTHSTQRLWHSEPSVKNHKSEAQRTFTP